MERTWPEDYAEIRKRKFRNEKDLAIPFLHNNYLIEQNKAHAIKETNYVYGTFTEHRQKNLKLFDSIKKKDPQCICLNDGLDDKKLDEMNKAIDKMTEYLNTLLPKPTPFELFD